MKKHIALLTVTAASFIFTAGLVSAATITSTTFDNSGSWYVNGVEQWATTGNKMDGIRVTAYFGTTSESVLWADNTGAVGTGWSLTMPLPNGYNDNTWYSDAWWILSNSGGPALPPLALTSLVIDGRPGNTVFDTILNLNYRDNGIENSPGSENGRSVVADYNISDTLNVAAQYGTRVFVNGTFYDDLYQTITFDFAQGLQTRQSFWFALDTDNVNPVPEPATMLLFGIGAMGIAAFRKRKDN